MKNHPRVSLRRLLLRIVLGLMPLLLAISAGAKDKADKVHYRGWIGGHYKHVSVLPPELRGKIKAGLLITSLATNTPAAIAGLYEGDLVMELNHQPVKSVAKFYQAVDSAEAGAVLLLKAWHQGNVSEYQVRAGRESFTHNGVFMMGLPGFFYGLELPSGAGFSLGPLGFKREPADERVELSSAEQAYYHRCDAKSSQATDPGWKAWLVVFQASTHNTIKAQEIPPSEKGS